MEKYLHHAFSYIRKDSEKIQADLFYFVDSVVDGLCGEHINLIIYPRRPWDNSRFYHPFEKFDFEEIKKLPLKLTKPEDFQEIIDEYFFLDED